MTVLRTQPLPVRAAVGHLLVPQVVVDVTMHALAESGDQHGPHEQLVLWAGRVIGADRLVQTAVLPPTDHGPQHVYVHERAVGQVARTIRRSRLTVVAQVHSHPGWDTRHSDGDDDLIVMRHEGMLSLVVAEYGRVPFVLDQTVGVHQRQDRAWVRVLHPQETVFVLPAAIEVSHG